MRQEGVPRPTAVLRRIRHGTQVHHHMGFEQLGAASCCARYSALRAIRSRRRSCTRRWTPWASCGSCSCPRGRTVRVCWEGDRGRLRTVAVFAVESHDSLRSASAALCCQGMDTVVTGRSYIRGSAKRHVPRPAEPPALCRAAQGLCLRRLHLPGACGEGHRNRQRQGGRCWGAV